MGSTEDAGISYDVLIIGGGLSGIFAIYRMRQLGLNARVLENGPGEGGTWLWNKYPGCRFDSESWTYGFSFSQEVLDEWDWSEHFAGQPEVLRYANFVTEKFGLREYMQFNTEVVAAKWEEGGRFWQLTDQEGRTYTTRWVITAMGILSKPTSPNIEGVHDFQGEAFHTTRWPENWQPANKRVGIIGVGATAIQIIPEIVKTDLKTLTVFQRTPNWAAPLRNEKISKSEMEEIRQDYPEIFRKCRESYAGFTHFPYPKKALEVSEEERTAHLEKIYATRGFAKWLSNFSDMGTSREANALVSKFFADKIRERVHDPATAEKLIPKDHGFGTRRLPLETHYFETYNRPNVRLIDVKYETSIAKITPKGVLLENGEEIELDTLIYATGFDAITGPISAVDFRGVDGIKITDVWKEGPRTFLGFMTRYMPNMMAILGPHQAFGNIPRSIEYAVDWIGELIQFCTKHGYTRVEARQDKVDEWTQHVFDCAKGLLASEVDSWMTNVNKNLKGKQKRIIARYSGPCPGFRKRIADVSAREYEDLDLK